jgi:hypothetical protein
MAFTPGELASIANAALDYFFEKGTAFKQSIETKPLIAAMERNAKTFSGGKGDISIGIKGNYGAGGVDDSLKGYTHNDTVKFYTPANIQRAKYPWRETHIGLTLTNTELKIDGLSLVDTSQGMATNSHTGRDMHVLVGLLNDKIEDLGEQYLRGLNDMLWGDGTADVLGFSGVQSIVTETPAVGTVGGINRAADVWWRNRARLGIASSPANGGVLAQALQNEHRQLVRFGGTPNLFLAGSDFINALEVEMRANGYYSDSGFTGGGDMGVGGIRIRGTSIQYDPWLDNNGKAKFGYWLDSNHLFLMKMQSEWRRQHDPARPYDQFVLHRSITSTGQVVANQCNSSGVYSIA